MKLISEGRCGRGVVRQSNQDNLFVNGKYREALSDREMMSCSDVAEAGIYAVCDGMGGEQYGEEASLLAVEALRCLPVKEMCIRDSWRIWTRTFGRRSSCPAELRRNR